LEIKFFYYHFKTAPIGRGYSITFKELLVFAVWPFGATMDRPLFIAGGGAGSFVHHAEQESR
ncbi:TPA: hypothetical protein ACXPW1_004788, partial [Klebsiella variicola subsp. variicola]